MVTWGWEAGNAGLFTRYQLPVVYNDVQHFTAVNDGLLQFTAEEITNKSCCGEGMASPTMPGRLSLMMASLKKGFLPNNNPRPN